MMAESQRSKDHFKKPGSRILPERWRAFLDGSGSIRRRGCGRAAFSLLEMLVAAGILVVIMLGLLGMFYQTDRALRLSLQQRDILDAGRTAMQVMVRDLSMMTSAENTNFSSFFVSAPSLIIVQDLDDSPVDELRTNALQQFLFLTKNNDVWNGIRYDFNQQNGVGVLYRMSFDRIYDETDPSRALVMTEPYADLVVSNLFRTNIPESQNFDYNFQYGRIAEGIVQLALRCYGADGALVQDTSLATQSQYENYFEYNFSGTNMPAYVELEFGVLEPKVFRLASAMTPAEAQTYLRDKAGAVQLFRQRIPVSYVPPTATATSTRANF